MQVTIQLSEGCKQVINMSEKAYMANEKSRKTDGQIKQMANDIAWDISRNNSNSVKIVY